MVCKNCDFIIDCQTYEMYSVVEEEGRQRQRMNMDCCRSDAPRLASLQMRVDFHADVELRQLHSQIFEPVFVVQHCAIH